MDARALHALLGSLAAVSLSSGAMGCAAPAGEDDPSGRTPARDEPLDVTVDSLDVVHGALRISATMVDGAADVSIRLGGRCERREVGAGFSTRSTLVWALRDDDVAEAIGCGLVVRARVRDGARYVNRVADLGVLLDVGAQGLEGTEDGPRLQTLTAAERGVGVVFSPVPPGAHLSAGDSILEPEPPGADEPDPAGEDARGRFTVPRLDFARSILRGRPLHLEGASFATSISVGGTALQVEPEEEPRDEG